MGRFPIGGLPIHRGGTAIDCGLPIYRGGADSDVINAGSTINRDLHGYQGLGKFSSDAAACEVDERR